MGSNISAQTLSILYPFIWLEKNALNDQEKTRSNQKKTIKNKLLLNSNPTAKQVASQYTYAHQQLQMSKHDI